MAVVNTVLVSKLEKTRRLDAEYYRNENLVAYKRILNHKHDRLSKIAHVADGNHLKIAEKFTSEGVRYLRGQDISSDMLIDDRNEVYVPESVFDFLKRSHILPNDVLITIVGANTGLIGLVYDPPSKLTANCKLGIARPFGIHAGYLYAFLTSRYGQNEIQQNKRGGGQTGLILPDMRDLVIPRLSSQVEAEIAQKVYDAHARVKQSKQIYAQAEKLLLSELGLLNWRPSHTLSYARKYSDVIRTRRLDAEHFQPRYQEMFARLPASVHSERLEIVATYTKGIEVGSSAYTDSGIPFWRVSNLTKHGLEDSNANFISEELYNSLRSSYEPQQGEMLLSKDATPGLAYYMGQPIKGIVSSGILRLSLVKNIQPHYLELILNSIFLQLQIEQNVGGSVIKHWKPSEVQKTLIPRLSNKKEQEIAVFVQQSHGARQEAKVLLEKAKRAVGIAIEQGEEHAISFLNT